MRPQPPFHHHPRKGRRRKSVAVTVTVTSFIFFVVICVAVDVDARSLRTITSTTTKDRVRARRESQPAPAPKRLDPRNETLSYQVAVFLAQEEAKCLQEFGGRENKTVLAAPYDVPNPFSCAVPGAPGVQDCEMCRSLTASLRRSREECSSFCGTSVPSSFCFKRCEAIRERSASVRWLQGGGGRGDAAAAGAENLVLDQPRVFCEDVVSPGDSETSFSAIATPPAWLTLFNDDNTRRAPARTRGRNEDEDEDVDAYSPFPQSGSEGGSGGAGSHSVYLKWRLSKEKTRAIAVKQTSSAAPSSGASITASDVGSSEIPFPVVFLVEYQTQEETGSGWILLGKRLSTVERVEVPYHSRKYRWRITAVGASGLLARVHSPQFFQTLDGFKEPGPPSSIFVAREIVNEASVDVLIGWEPPPERPCAYKINLYPMDTMEHYRTHRLTEPFGVNFHLLRSLKFGSKYDVTMTSRGDNWRFESTLKSQNFTTISCLEAHQYRFDKCDPPPPRNITQELLNVHEALLELQQQQQRTKSKLDVKLSWLPPPYTSPTNPILSYSVSLGPPLNETAAQAGNHKNILSAAFFRMNRNHNVPGNTTHIYLNELLPNTQYVIKLTAVSVKGKSQPVQYHMSTKLAVGKEEIVMPQTNNWLYLSVSISCLILALFACHFLRVFARKRKVKKARNQYFQTIEDRDAISADWSIVPLNDECYSLKMLGEFSKEKWEISYDKLVMGDVIGQGAFGVVRRAAMARKHFLALAKKALDNSAGAGGSQHPDEMETVAVKMLKVSATRDDRDQLIKEILTMQNLGSHAQIVSLLGACTKGRSLCLVMEYCPGGDLLTFLRKVRAKYWPTLGMVDSVRTTAENSKSYPLQTSTSARTSVSSTRTGRKSIDSSPINYADLEVLSDEYSSSPTTGKTTPGGALHEYGNTPPRPATTTTTASSVPGGLPPAASGVGVDFEDEDCRPIDEKDVLCYARQIAMGMEYLEKNHIVHRDLACRNVLLLGDYKQVKLSDFGLSRDVYTWNVYHQKSNGKLPIKWMAIESIFTHVFTSKSDVWSYGILLWELVTLGGTPYPGLANTELFQVLKSGYRMERPDNCSEELYALMKKCWRTAPASRPNFTELRRYVEAMMEAAEPSLYLSLMADLPTDYFHINRDDLLHTRLEHELSSSKDNVSLMSASNSASNLKRMAIASTIPHSTHRRSLSLRQQKHYESRKHAVAGAGRDSNSNSNSPSRTKTSSTPTAAESAEAETATQPKPKPEPTHMYLRESSESATSPSERSESNSYLPSQTLAEEKAKTAQSLQKEKEKVHDDKDETEDQHENEDVQRSLIKSSPRDDLRICENNNNIKQQHCNGVDVGFSRPGSAGSLSTHSSSYKPPTSKEANSVTIIENKTYDLI